MLACKFNEYWIWKREVRLFGCTFRAPTLDRLTSLWLHKLGLLGREEVVILRNLLRKGMTVIDAGANQGIYTFLMARLVSPGSVFAFEPEPVLFQQLVWNVRKNKVGNIVSHNIAVSNSKGRLTLRRGGINLGDNRVVAEPDTGPDRFEVIAARFDDLFEGVQVDFLKADLQGWEAAAFHGGRRLLEQNKDIIVMFEFWPYGLQKAGTSPERLLTFFHDLGFHLWQLRRGRLTLLEENALPASAKEFSYCNLVGARDHSLVGHLLTDVRR
jgi:FkbM family methyltransferase